MNVLTETPKKLPKELASIANNVAKGHAKEIGKEIRKFVVMKAKDVIKFINQEKKAIATESQVSTSLFIRGHERVPLKYFGAKQTKKGVTYRVSGKRGSDKKFKDSRGFIQSGFGPKIARLGNHVFVRGGPGVDPKKQPRKPIRKLYGPSVLGVYIVNDLVEFSQEQLSDELGKQVERRVRAIIVNQIRKQGRVEGISTEAINQRIQARFAK